MAKQPSFLGALKGPSPLPPVDDTEDDGLAPVSAEQVQDADDLIKAVKRGDADLVATLIQSIAR